MNWLNNKSKTGKITSLQKISLICENITNSTDLKKN